MRVQIIKCDLCGSEKEISTYRLPVFKLHDSTDGLCMYEHPYILFKEIDICPDCLMKCTNIYDDTVMGYGDISIKPNPELNARKEE